MVAQRGVAGRGASILDGLQGRGAGQDVSASTAAARWRRLMCQRLDWPQPPSWSIRVDAPEEMQHLKRQQESAFGIVHATPWHRCINVLDGCNTVVLERAGISPAAE
jgi:hypothetical protein